MSSKTDKILVGDKVDVYFENCPWIFRAEILYTPCATGDCFVLKDENGIIYNVQSYSYMKKVN